MITRHVPILQAIQTEIQDAGMLMPAASTSMPMPIYV
jgi:hypothetical protein